jgi:NADPH2:quinone reductase
VSLPTNYVTAYLALHTRAHVQPGEVVLVHGGAGGVGTATIQIASAALGRVIATDLGPDRAALCRQAGAQRVVDMTEESLLDAVEEFSEGHGADVVIDVVGGDAFHDSRRCIAFEGRIVVVGFMSGHIPELKVNQLILRNFAVLGVNAMTYLWEHPDLHRAARQRVVELCASGALAPVIHAEYQPDELWDVLDQLDQRLIQGKAVIRFAGGPA